MESAMNAQIRPSSARGHANHGWLDSHHSFSFGSWHNPNAMGFGPLRVINEDVVQPGRGFGTHPHRDMEIVSYVLSGHLGHRDSEGNNGVIRPGEVQLMSAGTGITHSEMNGSNSEPVHFLQIWLFPTEAKTKPRYAQKDFGQQPGLTLVASPDGRDGSLVIGSNTDIHRALLTAGASPTVALRQQHAYVHVASGTLDVNGSRLTAGDGMSLSDVSTLSLTAHDDVNALIFDLPRGS